MYQIINEYLGTAIMMIGVYLFCTIVIPSRKKKTILWDILLIILFTIPQTAIKINFTGTIKTTLMALINVIFINQLFKISYKKSIFLTFIYMVILLIPDIIEILFITKVLNMSVEFCYNSYGGTILANTSTCILFLIITFILRKPLRKLINTEIDNNKKILFLSSFTLISILMMFYEMWKITGTDKTLLLYLFSIIILIIILLSLIKQSIENSKITRDYEQLLEFMKTFEEEIENQRIIRHEAKNELLAIRAKICDKEREENIIEYVDNILEDDYKIEREKYAKFGYLPANGIKGLCYFKTQKAEEKRLNVSISISKKVKKSTIFDLDIKSQRDFAKILGVFLDNAIEASKTSKEKQLGIEAYTNSNNEFKMIISNTYSNKIDLEKLGKEKFTTKGKEHGHGLLLVSQIEKSNKIFETSREIKKDIYTQSIIIKKTSE